MCKMFIVTSMFRMRSWRASNKDVHRNLRLEHQTDLGKHEDHNESFGGRPRSDSLWHWNC